MQDEIQQENINEKTIGISDKINNIRGRNQDYLKIYEQYIHKSSSTSPINNKQSNQMQQQQNMIIQQLIGNKNSQKNNENNDLSGIQIQQQKQTMIHQLVGNNSSNSKDYYYSNQLINQRQQNRQEINSLNEQTNHRVKYSSAPQDSSEYMNTHNQISKEQAEENNIRIGKSLQHKVRDENEELLRRGCTINSKNNKESSQIQDIKPVKNHYDLQEDQIGINIINHNNGLPSHNQENSKQLLSKQQTNKIIDDQIFDGIPNYHQHTNISPTRNFQAQNNQYPFNQKISNQQIQDQSNYYDQQYLPSNQTYLEKLQTDQNQNEQSTNKQQIEFLEQQHGFVMQIMNFYEYHLNKMKQIVVAKSQEISDKDKMIIQFQIQQSSNILFINLILNKLLDDYKRGESSRQAEDIKNRERRLELEIQQVREMSEIQIMEQREREAQLLRNINELEEKLKREQILSERQRNRIEELEIQIRDIKKVEEKWQGQETKLQKTFEELYDIKLKYDESQINLKESQKQLKQIQDKLKELREKNDLTQNQLRKLEDQFQKSQDKFLDSEDRMLEMEQSLKIKNKKISSLQEQLDSSIEVSLKKMNQYGSENYDVWKQQPLKTSFLDNSSNNNIHQNKDREQCSQDIKLNISREDDGRQLRWSENNNGMKNFQRKNREQEESLNKTLDNINTSFNNNLIQGDRTQEHRNISQFRNNKNDDIIKLRSDEQFQDSQFKHNNNYYENIYLAYSNKDQNKRQLSKDAINNSESNEGCFYPVKQALTFPSFQNRENNKQMIRKLEQQITVLQQQKESLEAEQLKIPTHLKTAQQRLHKHGIEKNLEDIYKQIAFNRKQMKELQNQ